MAHNSVDPTKGFPQYSTGGAPSEAADLSEIAAWAGANIDRVVATQAALATSFTYLYAGLTTRVTAIPGAYFQYNGTTWDMVGIPYFATSAARDAAITSPAAGWMCYITGSNMTMEYNGAAWQRRGLVKPSSVVGTGASAVIGDDGTVALTALTKLIVTNAVVLGTDNYEIEISGGSSAGTIVMQLCAAGTPDASANYDWFGSGWNQAGTAVATTSLAQANWPISNGLAQGQFEATLEVRHANLAAPTRIRGTTEVVTTIDTAKNVFLVSMDHRASTAFNGFQLTFAQAFTGTVKVKTRP